MKYTDKQIENAKKSYTDFIRIHTLADYNVEVIGKCEAENRMNYHNTQIAKINAGDKAVEKHWKMFFINQVVMYDQKESERKAKLASNKANSSDILAPIKSLRKLGEFGKWLNVKGNPFRSQHFNKKYTAEAVNEFLSQL